MQVLQMSVRSNGRCYPPSDTITQNVASKWVKRRAASVLNLATHHKDVWGTEGIAPCIFVAESRYR